MVALVLGTTLPSWAADGRAVVVEFQPGSDDDAGIAYLLYSSVAEKIMSAERDDVIAGEDVEMFLGSAAMDCHRKRSCLEKLGTEFDGTVAVFSTISRKGDMIAVELAFISITTGSVLERTTRRYEAGKESELSDLILDRLAGAIDAAKYEEPEDGQISVESDRGDDDDDEVEWEEERDDHAVEEEDDRDGRDEEEDDDRDDRYRRDEEEDEDRDDRDDRYRRDEEEDDDRDDRYRRDEEKDDDRDDRDDRYRRDKEEDDDRDDRYRRDDDRDDDEEESKADRKAREKRERQEEKDRERAEREEEQRQRQEEEDLAAAKAEREAAEKRKAEEEAKRQEEDLLSTFDRFDEEAFDETERAGKAGDLTVADAKAMGMSEAELRRYQQSRMTLDEWGRERYSHHRRFHIRVAGFYALGGLDMYYSTRVVVDAQTNKALQSYWWQSLGINAASGGATVGVGFGVAPPIDLGLDVSILGGEQWLLREYRTTDFGENTFGTTPNPPPRGSAVYFMVEPKVRVMFLPYKKIKPYAGFGIAMLFLPGFVIPEEWAPDRPGSFVLGLEPTVGVQFDTPMGFGVFVELPFTGYIATDHGIEEGLEGDASYLEDEEMNDPYPATRFLLRVQAGVQIRF